MSNSASTQVSDVKHVAKGVESLTAEQRDLLAEAFGFKPASGYNLLGAAELPSKMQNFINDMTDHGDSTHWMSEDIQRQKLCATAFGLEDPSGLSQAEKIHQRSTLSGMLSELAI